MKRQIYVSLILGLIATTFLYGCARTTTFDTIQQTTERYGGRVDIGQFTYLPAEQGTLKQDQIETVGFWKFKLSLGENVSDFAKRHTAERLEKAGFNIGTANPLLIRGEVIKMEFKPTYGSVNNKWFYSIRYTITQKQNSTELLNKTYSQGVEGNQRLMTNTRMAEILVSDGVKHLLMDDEVKKIFSK